MGPNHEFVMGSDRERGGSSVEHVGRFTRPEPR